MAFEADSGGVAWLGRRLDVIEALSTLATLSVGDTDAFPSLTDAVHWLVDDTFWDQHSPSQEIGLILRNQSEVTAVNAVLQPLIEILDDLGPLAPDRQCFDHHQWPEMKAAAASAASELKQADARYALGSGEHDGS